MQLHPRGLRIVTALAIAVAAAAGARAGDPAVEGKALASAFKSLCIDTALSLDRFRAAWAGSAADGVMLSERAIDAATADPQARRGAPKHLAAPPGGADRVRLDGRLKLDTAAYDVAAVAPRGDNRLDACRIEAALEGIDAGLEAVASALGLEAPVVVGASQSSAYLIDPDPTIFKYVRYRAVGPVAVTIGLELKPQGRGNLLLIAEPAGGP